ncbi:hypothetical protein [Paenibacillus sp. LjRoot56]|uniref:hypothetical protein n=1 Tax=Paenibacillus sp. LjRoot56 TaxID=3342333 RepID=UPI003ECE7591
MPAFLIETIIETGQCVTDPHEMQKEGPISHPGGRGLLFVSKSLSACREKLKIAKVQLFSRMNLALITTLDTKQSLFFSHRDPEMVKWISNRKLDI